MLSESRKDRSRCIGESATADRLRDCDNAAGIGVNSAEIGENSAEIGDGGAGIVDIAANVIPCWTLSWMESGVTLFLEEKFQRGHQGTNRPTLVLWHSQINAAKQLATKDDTYIEYR